MKKALGPVHMVNCHIRAFASAGKKQADTYLLSHQEKIEAVNQALTNEYEVRRKMLLKRLDVTVQSFGWSDRAKVGAATQPLDAPRADLTKGPFSL